MSEDHTEGPSKEYVDKFLSGIPEQKDCCARETALLRTQLAERDKELEDVCKRMLESGCDKHHEHGLRQVLGAEAGKE